MTIGLIGLGRMGFNLALNMKDNGHKVICFNRSKDKVEQAIKEGLKKFFKNKIIFISIVAIVIICIIYFVFYHKNEEVDSTYIIAQLEKSSELTASKLN